MPFDLCPIAAETVGLPGGDVKSCVQTLPDFWWVNVVAPTGSFSGGVLVDGECVVKAQGSGVAEAWLTRIQVQSLPTARPSVVAQALQVAGALPAGFSAADLAPGGTLSPFRLEFVRPEPPPAGVDSIGSGPGHTSQNRIRAVLAATPAYVFSWTLERSVAGGPWVGE